MGALRSFKKRKRHPSQLFTRCMRARARVGEWVGARDLKSGDSNELLTVFRLPSAPCYRTQNEVLPDQYITSRQD